MWRLSLLNLTRWIFVIVGLVLVFSPTEWWPTYYRPILMGIVAISYSYLIALPRIIFKKVPLQTIQEFQGILAVNLILCSIGSLGLWSTSFWGVIDYDKLVHFIFSASMLVVGPPLLSRQYSWSIKKAVIISMIITAFSGIAWEFIEYFFAAYFHIDFFGTLFDHDSRFDLITNLSGIITGMFFVTLRYRFSPSI